MSTMFRGEEGLPWRQAATHLNMGRVLRRRSWAPGIQVCFSNNRTEFIIYPPAGLGMTRCQPIRQEGLLTIDDLDATDWEIVE